MVVTFTGTYPPITVNPTSLTFANTAPNSSSAPQTFTVTGPNGVPVGHPVTVTATLIAAGSPSNFTFPGGTTCAASTTAICTFTAAFAPTGYGNNSITYYVKDTVSGYTSSIQLYGNSPAPAQAVFSSSSLYFSPTYANSSSSSQTNLTNTGTATLNISSLAITGATSSNFTQTNSCPAALATNAACTITVTFSPKVTGSQTATLQVLSNSASSPDTVALAGTGK